MLDYNRYCFPGRRGAKTFFAAVGYDKLGQYLSDLYSAWKILSFAGILGFLLSFLYIILMRCCPKLLLWCNFAIFLAGLAALGYLFYDEALYVVDETDQFIYEILAYSCWSVDAICFLFVICTFNKLQLTLNATSGVSEFVYSNCCMILVPFFAFLASVILFIYWIITVVHLYSIGTVRTNAETPFGMFTWDKTLNNLWYLKLVGLIWVEGFIIAMAEFIVATAASHWYFNSHNDVGNSISLCRAFCWGIIYHSGSLAFGGLCLILIKLVHFICDYICESVMSGDDSNCFSRCTHSCFTCYLRCIGEFVLYANKNAYVHVFLPKD